MHLCEHSLIVQNTPIPLIGSTANIRGLSSLEDHSLARWICGFCERCYSRTTMSHLEGSESLSAVSFSW
jgi:hypothetical protein